MNTYQQMQYDNLINQPGHKRMQLLINDHEISAAEVLDFLFKTENDELRIKLLSRMSLESEFDDRFTEYAENQAEGK